ncbi:M1 family metallopeptidase [Mucilaginibacter phyllosphaerae]|uniref:Aminopeptidase N n=1 Tax=Mucilaginibacter phyllosphaerae TaxID=1812349 RepID=A0A4Y8AG66_9SPHI|nr:M1 family metallopeptidase [Mucilaginibacter phyllosphaerae]MBB3968607.1 aminopeptidase N [Mucilaginibacter phyllosphaerae]TEW67754.1 M1 family peptidase [Mucilaginibacter phyllosphaerae]
MKIKRSIYVIILLAGLISSAAKAQLGNHKETFTRADTLRGMLTPLRTCYDINYYHLDVKFDIDNKFISGNVLFKYTATQDFTKLQFDLFSNMKVEKVVYKGKEVPYTREFNAVFVTFPQTIKNGSKDEFTVFYSGNPTIAKRAPWDGGVEYNVDSLGHKWVSTACQGMGASVWWPTKDHQADEVDSALISISVPNGLKDVSNGRLRKVTKLKDGYTRFDWFVANPINNYNIEANIGDYVHYTDTYMGEKGKLTLDFWPLSYNLEKAKKQWGANTKPMIKAFEHWFGPYPFYEDGYKLVETHHLGMEHQSGTAYGNHYQNGYLGRDLSGTGWGLKWDFIVIHESGHEWFANNITSKDLADMWIHESFTNYSESLFIEDNWGKQAGQEYVHGTRLGIQNDGPIIGPYNVNKEGSGDMYYKGGNLLNMVRTIINDDEKWRGILRGLNKTFYHQTVTTEQIVGYINEQSGKNLTPVFDQYLRHANIPTLEFMTISGKLMVRWIADERAFNMPVKVRLKGGEYQFITPKTRFMPLNIEGATKDNIEVDTFNYYIGVLMD